MCAVRWLRWFILIRFFDYSNTQYASYHTNKLQPYCEGNAKKSIVEHFFNVIFTEFNNTPPNCLCVQMCVGESTYCYPNGCLKMYDPKKLESPQALTSAKQRNKYMFVVDDHENNPDILNIHYEIPSSDDIKSANLDLPKSSYQHGIFDENQQFAKYKKSMPQIEMTYNLREHVKNIKSDLLGFGYGNKETKWPKSRLLNSHKVRPYADKKSTFINKPKVFASVVTENVISMENQQKYFKRDLQRSKEEEKDLYFVNNFENITDFASISLDTLIDNLIKSHVDTTESKTAVNETIDNKLNVIPLNKSEINHTAILSMNHSRENLPKNEYNKVSDDSSKLNTMIKYLSSKIDKQINTTMEMTKRMVTNMDFFDIGNGDVGNNDGDIFKDRNIDLDNTTSTDYDLGNMTINKKESDNYDPFDTQGELLDNIELADDDTTPTVPEDHNE